MRLLFVVDEAPRELRRLVEFLNAKLADVEMLIVEIKQYQGAGQTALAPRVLGISEAARIQKSGVDLVKPNLTQQQFLQQATLAQRQVAEWVWGQAKQRGYPTRVDFYFAFLPLSDAATATLRQQLLATGLFVPSGKQTLTGQAIDSQTMAKVKDVLALIFERVAEILKEV